ncbi:MAG TPA: DUF3106 domain-containing protein [Lysobacter sp.]
MRRDLRFALGLVLCAMAAAAGSTPPPLAGLIERLPPSAQAPLRRNVAQWTAWSPAQRDEFRQRVAQWDGLPRAERDERRERYLAWQALPADERAQVRNAAARYATMTPDLQHGWRAQFDALDRSDRRAWLLGPALGADYAMLQPLLAQVPEAEHEPLLRTLRAMTPQQRRDLGVLAQRTPPTRREALRRDLLATTAADRGDWLWRQLQH